MNPNKEIVETKQQLQKVEAAAKRLTKIGYISLFCNLITFVLLIIFYVMI